MIFQVKKLALLNAVLAYSTILCYGRCQERPNDHTEMIIYNQEYAVGDSLTCKANIGLNMCIETCAKTGGCVYAIFDSNKLFCELMETDITIKTSHLQEKYGKMYILKNNATVLCEPSVCQTGYTCVQLSNGRNTCMPIDRKCCENRFLVTGPYGVGSNSVTYSSVFAYDAHSHYYLDSNLGWAAGTLNAFQWIQVVFNSRKTVQGVVTQGRIGNTQWVSSYRVRYKVPSGAWEYFKDESGVITLFPGNSGLDDKKINYFPKPVRTTGIEIRPQTWVNWITLRFDVLGC